MHARPLVSIAVALSAALSAQRPAAVAAEPMAAAARELLATLGDGQREAAAFPFGDAERQRWSFFPGRYPGIELGALNEVQKAAAHELLRSALSSAGYLKTISVVRLESVLRELEQQAGRSGDARDPGRYSIAIFGEPGGSDGWGWRLQGHHVSLNFTSHDGLIATTPAFLGANPHRVRSGALAGLVVLGAEEDLARALLASLDEAQRTRALVAPDAPADILLGPGHEPKPLQPEGLPASAMTQEQRELLWRLVREYVENSRPSLAEAQLARIRAAGVERIAFAWAGGTAVGQPHYYRVQGPTFVIEYDNTQDDANHVHTVFRDFERDFGGDPLREHLQRDHHLDDAHDEAGGDAHSPAASSPAYTPTDAYRVATMRGWTLRIAPGLDAMPDLRDRVLAVLGDQLFRITRVIPEPALSRLKEVPIWVEKETPKTACMCFHVSKGWLVPNGYNPDKERAVEVGNARAFLSWTHDQPWMVLHELAHAYHYRVLGGDNPEIHAAWQAAVASGRYDDVLHVSGRHQRHYALTSDKEWFAELSESLWGRNDFYPFVRAELADFDPDALALIERLWRRGG